MSRAPVSFIAWSSISGRSREIAAALGGDSICLSGFRSVDRRLIPLGYIVSAVRTVAYLMWRRPRAVIVTNPPIFPSLIAYAYGRISGAPVLLDSHPSSFGFEPENTVVQFGMPFHRFLMPRVAASLVTEQSLVEMVVAEGGRAEILHEAEPRWSLPAAPPLGRRPRVLLVSVFAYDEPVQAVVEAAGLLPEVDFKITGDLRRRPAGLAEITPPNVEYTGMLDQQRYIAAIGEANVVMSLTDRPEDVSRSAYESVFARRPLILSDWPATPRYFPHALAVDNTPEGIAAVVQDAIGRYDELLAVADDARELQLERWRSQLRTLRELTGAG